MMWTDKSSRRAIPSSLSSFTNERQLWERYPALRPAGHGFGLMPPIVSLTVIVLLWYVATGLFQVPNYILPMPHVVVDTLIANFSLISGHLAVTLFEAVLGLALAVIVGFGTSFLVVWSPWLGRAILPLLAFVQTTPKVAIAPLLLLWFGFGYAPKIAIAFLISFFPIVIATVTGLNSAQRELLELVRSLSSSTREVFFRVRVPSALPFFFSGLKVAVTLSLIGALVGEFVGSDRGLGYLILSANGDLNAPLLFAGIVITSLMGFVLFSIVELVERVAMPWHTSVKVRAPSVDERA